MYLVQLCMPGFYRATLQTQHYTALHLDTFSILHPRHGMVVVGGREHVVKDDIGGGGGETPAAHRGNSPPYTWLCDYGEDVDE